MHRPARPTPAPSPRRSRPHALVLAAALALGACGGDDEGDGDDDPPSTPATATDAPADDAPADDAPDDVAPDDDAPTPDARALGPLPSPPLTPPPGPDDEPLRAAPGTTTITEIFVVENRPLAPEGPPSAESLGPLPRPLVLEPPGVDLADNRPPFFEGLARPELAQLSVLAGEPLELELVAIDPDGDVAGQYLGERPERAFYRDNFDTTRTLVWTPLEADVGVHDIVAYAVDAQVPSLHVRHTVRVTVEMPSDPSTIPNAPPAIDRVDPHPARLGDPIVIHVKGTDANGTAPELELLEGPPGASFRPHHEEPAVRVLSFVAERLGPVDIEVLARDARDASLIARRAIVVDVSAPSAFERPGARLRELAAARDFSIGFAALPAFYRRPDGALYADIAAEEFDLVTMESSLKWSAVNPRPGVYRWADTDNLLAWAELEGLRVHGHTLVWYTALPRWIRQSEPELREGHMREHIDRVLARYADRIELWDVVNEALDEDGSFRESVWFEAMGEGYVDIAFRQARASAPEATLLYNDYDIGFDGPKADALFALLESLRERGTPIDGVGFQMHVSADFDAFDELAANFARVAALDLDVYVTELDVRLDDEHDEQDQARVYEGVLSVCLAEPRCRALQTWGFTDRYSWLKPFTPLIMDEDYRPKPAYRALQRRLGEP